MTTKIQNLVTEAVSLDREISDQTERLKEIKAQLVEAAREREDELVGESRWSGSNRRQAVYKTATLPLSYTGLLSS